MNYDEETYVIKTLEKIRDQTKETNKLVKENNIMLKQIIKYLNYEASNARRENEDDFGRNVLANLISNAFNIKF